MNRAITGFRLAAVAALWAVRICAVPVCTVPALAAPDVAAPPQSDLCRAAISAAATANAGRVPEKLMHAISLVETGRRNPATGAWGPWPWTINAEGSGRFFDTKMDAIQAVQALVARGVRSIDVGCMQVNLMHHAAAFSSLDEAFDPPANARYGARFLLDLRLRTGSWDNAAAGYHSATPELGVPYAMRVLAIYMPGYQPRFTGANAQMAQNAAPGTGTVLPTAPTPQQRMAAAWGATLAKPGDGKAQHDWSRGMMQAVGAAQPAPPTLSVGQTVGRTVGEAVGRTVGQSVGRTVGQPVASSASYSQQDRFAAR